jgi:hypothetical protein
MSHFTVTVALPADVEINEIDAALTEALAPFDEERRIEQFEEDGETYWRNPQAHWDWWSIGGRWRGRFLTLAGADRDDIVCGTPSWTNEKEPADPAKCDGGRIRALDIEAARATAAAAGERDWNRYAMVIDGTPQHIPWSDFAARLEVAQDNAPKDWDACHRDAVAEVYAELGITKQEADAILEGATDDPLYVALERRLPEAVDAARETYWGSVAYNWDQARADYAAQPRIRALRTSEAYKKWFDGPEDIFDHLTRDEYIEQCRNKAIPGFATLTHDGRWLAEGEMGWFGADNSTPATTATYLAEVNKYLDSLESDMWLINIDCHI